MTKTISSDMQHSIDFVSDLSSYHTVMILLILLQIAVINDHHRNLRYDMGKGKTFEAKLSEESNIQMQSSDSNYVLQNMIFRCVAFVYAVEHWF